MSYSMNSRRTSRHSSSMKSESNLSFKSYIKLSPKDVIRFTTKYSSYYLSEDIVLVNKSPDSIMYKIKSNTKCKRYRLSTTTGIIHGHSGLKIQIILDAAEANNITNDVIVVETQYCNSDDISSDDDLQQAMRRYHEKMKGVVNKRGTSFRLRCVLDVQHTETDFMDTSKSGNNNNILPQPPSYQSRHQHRHAQTPASSKVSIGDVQYRKLEPDLPRATEFNSVFDAVSHYVMAKHNYRINWTNIYYAAGLMIAVYMYNLWSGRKELLEQLAEQAENRAGGDGFFSNFFKDGIYDD